MRSARSRAAALRLAPLLAPLLALFGPAAPVPAQMQQLETTIALDYSYEQVHLGPEVTASAGFRQKYQVRLETSLTSSLDFFGAVTIDLEDRSATDTASSSGVSPSLEFGVKGPQSGARFTYSGSVGSTDEYQEAPESTKSSNAADLSIDLTPNFWPELKFKISEKRTYEAQRTDSTSRDIELQLRDEIYDLRLEFSLKLGSVVVTLPDPTGSESVDWSGKATYKETFFGDVEFETDYEIKESYAEDTTLGVFTGLSEEYTQTFRARLRKSLELTPLLNMGLSWEYGFDQDLLALSYDYKVQNRYALEVRYDFLPSLQLAGEARRETEFVAARSGAEDTSKVADTLKGAFDYEPVDWLRFAGRAEHTYEQDFLDKTGGSIARAEERQYELTLKNRWGDFWDLTAGTSTNYAYTDGQIDDQESKLKADLKLLLLKLDWMDMVLLPRYEASRKDSWDGPGDPTGQDSTSDGKIKFEVRAELLNDLLLATFSHEYGQKLTEKLTETLSFTRVVEYNENTRLNLAVVDLIRDLNIEGVIERSADDVDDDAEPELVEISYALKLDWKHEDLFLSSAFRYNDRAVDDDVEFATRVGWKGDQFDVSGDYQFTKTYSDATEEKRKLNLKCSYRF